MIQAATETNFTTFLQTEDNRINFNIPYRRVNDIIRHLFKFTNDMDGSVVYSYPVTEVINPRYTKFTFTYDAGGAVLEGLVNLSPAGYWKYEVYEVTWENAEMGALVPGKAPVTENDVLKPVDNQKGIVQGLVTKGKMYVAEKAGTEEVSYIQNAKSVQTLTIAYGGTDYESAPTITITGDCITQATATCTIEGGVVNEVHITNAGSGYTENPTVTVSGDTEGNQANITANIEQTNYIYTG
jgi:hypothetical protein